MEVLDPAQISIGAVDRTWYVQEVQRLVDKVLGTIGGTQQLSILDMER